MHDIFTFCDIHGMYDLYKAIMNYCNEQDPEATIVFIGDACDRGPDGYKIMKELLDNPRVIYLKGNHEDLFCKAARQIVECFDFQTNDRERIHSTLNSTLVFDYRYEHIQLAVYNGGIDTLTDWILDGQPMKFVERIEKLPLTFSTDKYDFCHAGGNYQAFEHVAEAEYNGTEPDKYFSQSVIWDRNHIENYWKNERICIFGHTPTPALDTLMHVEIDDDLDPMPYVYALTKEGGMKIDMDTGAAFRGVAWVLNVLTMKAQGFEDIDIINKEIRKHDVKKIYSIQL